MDLGLRFYELKEVLRENVERERKALQSDEAFLLLLPEKESLAEAVVALSKTYVDAQMARKGEDLRIILYPAYVLDAFEEAGKPEDFFVYLDDIIRYEEIMEGSFYERIPRMR